MWGENFRRRLKSDNTGFIALVAIGLFAIMGIFALIVQIQVSSTAQSIINSRNYYDASDLAAGTLEKVRFNIKNHGAGYNLSEDCLYSVDDNNELKINLVDENGDYKTNFWGGQAGELSDQLELCPDFSSVPEMAEIFKDKDVRVKVELRGHTPVGESLKGECANFLKNGKDCYVVPSPGSGDAAFNCESYEPVYQSSDEVNAMIPLDESNGEIDQIEHPCNWNKLTLGSSLTDRMSIPLFFENENWEIVNPFWDGGSGGSDVALADSFAFRVRTPCLPCAASGVDAVAGETRDCTGLKNKELCDYDERYVLAPDPAGSSASAKKTLVQWQLKGECDGEPCTVVEYGGGKTALELNLNSKIDAGFINDDKKFLSEGKRGFNVSNGKPFLLNEILPILKNAFLQAMIVNKLISDSGIPLQNLEYQFLSNYPVANNVNDLLIEVKVGNSIFREKYQITNKQGVIDFAIQN